MKKYSRVRAMVSLDAIAHNFREMKNNIRNNSKILAVIKADGYGHGAVPIAHLVEKDDQIWGFAVATVEEALELRAAGVEKPVLILGIAFEEYYPDIVEQDIRPTVCDFPSACLLSQEGKRQGKTVHIHLALDTGMSRIGFADVPESIERIKSIACLDHLKIEGIFTHFARADEYDRSPALIQLERYHTFLDELEKAGVEIPLRHCSNSAGIIRVPEAHLSLVRAGISIYGIYPSGEVERDVVKLVPAMELKSRVTFVKTVPPGTAVSYGGTYVTKRETRVATIPVGYADGYPRGLSNKGRVLIRGRRAPILGRVCMDQFMVDVTEIPGVMPGDEVTLIGRDGEEQISVEELGELSGRFPYEFVCGISKRVPRIYLQISR